MCSSDLFPSHDIRYGFPVTIHAELESVVTSVLSTFADDGFIATIEGLKQFSVNVPVPTSSNRNERLLEGTFKYIPNGAAEWVTITGQEVFDIINGEEE